MAIRNVVQVGDDVLRKKCFAVARFDEKLATLLDDMKDTVRKEEGAGLAAPQVGVLRRAVVIDVEEGFFELVNPVIVQAKGEQIGYEGCLSVRGRRGVVRRPMEVTVEFFRPLRQAAKAHRPRLFRPRRLPRARPFRRRFVYRQGGICRARARLTASSACAADFVQRARLDLPGRLFGFFRPPQKASRAFRTIAFWSFV